MLGHPLHPLAVLGLHLKATTSHLPAFCLAEAALVIGFPPWQWRRPWWRWQWVAVIAIARPRQSGLKRFGHLRRMWRLLPSKRAVEKLGDWLLRSSARAGAARRGRRARRCRSSRCG